MASMTLPGNIDEHHEHLLAAGIEFHTLEPTKNSVKAWVFQAETDKELKTQMVNYPKKDAYRIVSA